MIVAKVWNSEKLSNYYHGKYACNTLEGINGYEKDTGFRLSSEITANNEKHLKEILESVYNETDVNLCYHVVKGDV